MSIAFEIEPGVILQTPTEARGVQGGLQFFEDFFSWKYKCFTRSKSQHITLIDLEKRIGSLGLDAKFIQPLLGSL
jgi:hypothetical protein